MNRREFLSVMVSSGLAVVPWQARAMAASPDPDVRFLRPIDADYDSYRALFNSRIRRSPAVIAVCQTEAGVQKAVLRARRDGLSVAIKSGGHHFEGYSSNDGGMCIDLTLMNRLRLIDGGRVLAEPSVRLMQVYENLMPQGRLLPTGSCAMVGLSGITLGGGYGLFSREYGLTCDWLRRARIVDGHGRAHEVRDGTELMWALRGGGGGGLGVVTELEFDTVPCPTSVWSYRFKFFNQTPVQLAKVTGAWFAISGQLPRQAFSAYVLFGTTLTVLVTSTAPDGDADLRAALEKLRALASKAYPPQQRALPDGIRTYYGKLTPLPFRNGSAGFFRHYGDIETAIAAIAGLVAGNPGLLMQINTLGGAIDDPVPDNHSVYAHRGYPFLGEIQSYWEDPARAPALIGAVDKVQSLLATAGVARHYANYADGGLADWRRAYYGAAGYQRLQTVKRQLDPDDLFRHPQSIDLSPPEPGSGRHRQG